MRNERFPWTRTWTRLQGATGPRSPVGSADPRDTRPLAGWADTRCLVLLGEGGLGKSDELREEARRLKDAGNATLVADLGSTTDRNDLIARILPGHPLADATLLIDGFDEVFADVTDIADVLTTYLDTLDCDQVFLRITSRPAIWSTRLENQLTARWPDATVLVLDPPSRSDIRIAATAVLDAPRANEFMDAVAARDLWTLASSPITLELLLGAFAESGEISGSRLEIYRAGVGRLVSERHDRRLDRGRTGAPAAARLEAARTLAFLSMLSGRPTISTRPLPNEDVLDLDDIAGNDGHPAATLREVAQSAVLRPSGTDAVTWAHRSFAEFLAAEEIRALPLPTLLNLLAQPTHPARIAPPLTQIAGWVASTREDLFDWLVAHDLDVLLGPNLADATPSRRRQVAEEAIAAILSGRSFDWRAAALSSLAHDQLADSLRTHLTDDNVATEPKTELLRIAWHTGVNGLGDVLVDMIATAALQQDYDEIVSLGRWAIIALKADRMITVAGQLLPLATDGRTNRWIRSDLLERLHPEWIDAASLLALLPNDVLSGLDSTYLELVGRARELAETDREALLALLHWLADQPEEAQHDHFFGEAFDDAAASAIAQLDDEPVADALARLFARHPDHSYAGRTALAIRHLDSGARRALLTRVADEAENPSTTVRAMAHQLVDAEDFGYYVELAASDDDAKQTTAHWAMSAAHAALMKADADVLEAMVTAAKRRRPGAADDIEVFWGPGWRALRLDALASAAAWQATQTARRALDNFDRTAIDDAVADANWAAAAQALYKPVGKPSTGHVHRRRLSRGSAWQALDETTQEALIDLAVSAVSMSPHDPRTIPAIADGIGLIADVAPARLEVLPGARWCELVSPMLSSAEEADVCALVIDRAARVDSAAVDDIVVAALRTDVASHHTMTLDRLGSYRPDELDVVLSDLVADAATTDAPTGRLLADLLARNIDGAAGLAVPVVEDRPEVKPTPPEDAAEPLLVSHGDDSQYGRAIRRWRRAVAAAAALAVAPVEAVAHVDLVAIVTADWEFTSDIARRLGIYYRGDLFPSLTADDLAKIYLWVDARLARRQYAPGRAYEVDSVQDLPNTILQTIGSRQDDAAAAALRRIADHRSSLGIRGYAERVQRAADTARWQPVPIAELRAVLKDAERRVITTSAQLAQAVHEAIDDYATAVRTDAARRRRLWVPAADGHAPRTEEEVSDELSIELEHRLRPRVAVHREVRIEPRSGQQSASDVDLLVTVFDIDTTVSCIVEVKANWFAKLVDRIAAQLVDRYLAGPVSEAGVFVVLWFAAADWSTSDPRARKALKNRKRFDDRLQTAMADYVDRPVHAVVVDCTLEQHA